MGRKKVLEHIEMKPAQPIPSQSVLESYLEREPTNWREFLQRINEHGLDPEQLVIALRAKEREIKEKGRFFAMMAWELREYFVVTEHLIKTHFVPLFHGLTMADDHNSVIEKMLLASDAQNPDDPSQVNYANHLDYSKWNNHQRGEANDPVFRVMGQFLGLPNLLVRTHEFFGKSLIYYKDRPDLMRVENGTVVTSTEEMVCWKGQPGGLEGLRQKGWSVVNYLGIERQAKIRNTQVRCLAQGDNQIICTLYKTRASRTREEAL
ncbi:AAEL017355-PA [Aedes aegypti]|uniref:AAEL017355-PA n=1 Tax=Aedes aegypti TaxID=7159 RepID=J9HY81_AEDAE|nr:AAEL017355-PA [Aedes aegypti]